MRIEHDDDLLEFIEKANIELAPHNLEFVDDAEEHDGFCIYSLKNLKP